MEGIWERRLGDGREVVLRAAVPQDVAAIARLYGELSPESFISRFFAGRPAPELVARLAGLDAPPGAGCVVAEPRHEPGRLAAEARYVRLAGGAAEIGIAVLDSYQGAGLGRLLLDVLRERAGASGIERLRAIVSTANYPMLHLLGAYPWVLAEPTDEGVCLEISTAGGVPGWPADARGPRILVERRSWYDDGRVAALRSTGCVRQCVGPRRLSGRDCPLLDGGGCRLAEEADLIVSMLPGADEECAAVVAAHQRLWPQRLAAG